MLRNADMVPGLANEDGYRRRLSRQADDLHRVADNGMVTS